MKKRIVTLFTVAAIAAVGPVHAERILTNGTQDDRVHNQLCATDTSQSNCGDTGPSAKDLLLANGPTSDGPTDNPTTFAPPTVNAVPEPSGWLGLVIGGAALLGLGRRRRP